MDNELRIINYLGKHRVETYTLHQLSKLVSIPYATFYRTIPRLDALITIAKVGKAKTIRINADNPLVRSYLAVSSGQEAREFLKNKQIIQKIASEITGNDIVVLFGSYAKSEETEKSDIDIVVINKKGEKSISFSKYEVLYKRKVNPIFMTIKEFHMMLKEKDENVGKQVLKNHIVLNNPQGFWEVVLGGI
jgi:predicted nucleotidyltransferase